MENIIINSTVLKNKDFRKTKKGFFKKKDLPLDLVLPQVIHRLDVNNYFLMHIEVCHTDYVLIKLSLYPKEKKLFNDQKKEENDVLYLMHYCLLLHLELP